MIDSEKNQNTWKFTEVVDSKWAGTVQIKWCTASGQSFHSTSDIPRYTWLDVLTNIYWIQVEPVPIETASDLLVSGRFEIYPHIVFGDNQNKRRENHGVFMIDTYSGATYVLAVRDEEDSRHSLRFPFHDVFEGCLWHRIEEQPETTLEKASVGRYVLSAINSVEHQPRDADGRLGPYVTRINQFNGDVDVAVPKRLINAGSEDVDFIWHRIRHLNDVKKV